jgi:hydrogenase nickel incorporation protein HypA/HybF
MHELPITEQIIKIALKHAENARASKIEKIILVVGEQSGFIGDSIQMYFDIIAKDTLCEGAELLIKSVKPKLRCRSCGILFERKPFSYQCTCCGGDGEPTEIGKEFYLESIEVSS